MVGKRRKTYYVVCFCILPLQKTVLTLKLGLITTLNCNNKNQKKKFRNKAKMKKDEQNENFRLHMQKTMSNLYLIYEIQNTRYKIQNTNYKVQSTSMTMIHVKYDASQNEVFNFKKQMFILNNCLFKHVL